jgi:hypothetical protein
MNRAQRDTLLLISLFLVETGLPLGWAYFEGMVTPPINWQPRGLWSVLAFLALSELWLFTLNMWAIRRGEFRWRREGVVTTVLIAHLVLITLPLLSPIHGEING